MKLINLIAICNILLSTGVCYSQIAKSSESHSPTKNTPLNFNFGHSDQNLEEFDQWLNEVIADPISLISKPQYTLRKRAPFEAVKDTEEFQFVGLSSFEIQNAIRKKQTELAKLTKENSIKNLSKIEALKYDVSNYEQYLNKFFKVSTGRGRVVYGVLEKFFTQLEKTYPNNAQLMAQLDKKPITDSSLFKDLDKMMLYITQYALNSSKSKQSITKEEILNVLQAFSDRLATTNINPKTKSAFKDLYLKLLNSKISHIKKAYPFEKDDLAKEYYHHLRSSIMANMSEDTLQPTTCKQGPNFRVDECLLLNSVYAYIASREKESKDNIHRLIKCQLNIVLTYPKNSPERAKLLKNIQSLYAYLSKLISDKTMNSNLTRGPNSHRANIDKLRALIVEFASNLKNGNLMSR